MFRPVSCRRFSTALLALAAGVAAMGCGAEDQAPPAPAPPEVTVASPVTRDVTNFAEFTGRTESIAVVDVRARVVGELQTMHFQPSGPVRQGDLLFVIEPEPYEAAVAAARANIAQWESELLRARSDLSRVEQAIQTNAVSEQEVDAKRADVQRAEANLAGAQAGLTTAEINLSYTQVRSPITGMVSRNFVDVGNLVGASENTLLTTVVAIQPLYAYFNISETMLLEMLAQYDSSITDLPGKRIPVPVFLGVDTEAGWPHEGVMDYIDNTVDTSTGTIQVRGTFANADARLFPGLFSRIRVPLGIEASAVLVEETAIGTDLGGKFVLVVGADDIVELRHVELGALEDDGLRVVRSGLAADERYIINGLQRARPGLPVTPTTGS